MPIRLAGLLLGLGLLLLTGAGAQEEPDGGPAAQPEEQSERGSSSRRRSLPEDDFQPSERVSEDYPVPFPTDI